MRVSFDLDDTLFVNPNKIRAENRMRFPYYLIYTERLRFGSIELMKKMLDNGIDLWIYTTSYRSEAYIRKYFLHYGIKIKNIVNGTRHLKEVQGNRKDPLPSKYPSKYGIDFHIDDDASVLENGKIYGFKVYLLGADDSEWSAKLWEQIEKAKRVKERRHTES